MSFLAKKVQSSSSSSFFKGASSIRFLLCFSTIFLSKSTWLRVARGSAEILGKSHACDWECCQIVLPVDLEGHSVQSSHLYQMICGCVRRRGLFTHLMDLMVRAKYGQRSPEALPDRSIALSVFLGLTALMAFSCLCYGFLVTNQSQCFSQHLLSNLL